MEAPQPGSPVAGGPVGLCLALVVCVFVGQAAYYWQHVNDDAYITFRYSQSLVLGRGPYFNPGEHVEGYTNFLLMLLVAAAIALWGPGAAAPVAKGIGVAAGAASVVVAFLLARLLLRDETGGERASDLGGLAAAGLVAASPAFAVNSTSGLETALFALAVCLGVLLGIQAARDGRWRGAGFAFAAAYLTRPEGLVLFAVYWTAQAAPAIWDAVRGSSGLPWRRLAANVRTPRLPRGLAADGLIVAAVLAGHLAFRLIAYDGEWLPNTYYAKIGGHARVTAASYISQGALPPLLGVPGVLVALAGLATSRAGRRAAAPVLIASLAGIAEPCYTGPDWMPGWRLVIPYLPLMAAWAAAGWCLAMGRAAGLLMGRTAAWRLAGLVAIGCVPVLWSVQSDVRRSLHDHVSLRALGYATGHRALALWLRDEATRQGDAVALMDVGVVGYLCPDLRILDTTGLTDRHIAKSAGGFLDKDYDPAYLLDRRPKYVVLVFTDWGRSYERPASLAAFAPGPPMDARIAEQPEFRRWYVSPRPAAPADPDWKDQLAARIGAERVFEHGHPGHYYLLAAFRRRDAPAPSS